MQLDNLSLLHVNLKKQNLIVLAMLTFLEATHVRAACPCLSRSHARAEQDVSPSSQAITELSAEVIACCSPGEGSCVADASCAIMASDSALLGGNLMPAHRIQQISASTFPFAKQLSQMEPHQALQPR